MRAQLLHSVIDQLLCTIEERPELAPDVMHFIFDDDSSIRHGLSEVRTRPGNGTQHANGSVSFSVGVELLASRQLLQFAAAVSAGVVPEMALPGGA
ncbi:hypothetical protein [Paraburkholderia phenoliruptrix]|uniref:hypothetical protein n=1 Tax=Paraburkholderia phenoliruptrix TaxID=252970 RepID=UPI001C6EB0E9|nr:hypothetical protein [Paraburkholderia phenoliruptrix]MBW9102919.1 hypothetical protein [Paraburkholderia phenoliruptrix]MBW9132893.1 hypothetical protein [Paraburkholderia ginsengiterrae]